MEHTELQILNGVFFIRDTHFTTRFTAYLRWNKKFYLDKYHNAKWQGGLISYGELNLEDAGSNTDFFLRTENYEKDVLFFFFICQKSLFII